MKLYIIKCQLSGSYSINTIKFIGLYSSLQAIALACLIQEKTNIERMKI
jgi:hypothetical protein